MEFDICREPDHATELAWHEIRNENPELRSGYFHPGFYSAVKSVRPDVELVVLHHQGTMAGVFPFQRMSSRIAHPVGGMMNDFHGVLARAETRIDFRGLMDELGIHRFDFHALSTSGLTGQAHSKLVFDVLDSPYIDLSGGQAEYRKWLQQHSSTVRRQSQKSRALARSLGPIRLDFDVRDPAVLEKLIAWKREKFRRTRTFDLLSVDWTANLLREVFQTRSDGFRGLLSGLWAGDTLVAAHFGFLCGSRLHYWFPAYDHAHGRYSPGTELMKEVIHACGDHAIDRIDLSYGQSDLKDRFANRATTVEVGCFAANAFSRRLGHRRYQMRQLVKRAPLKETLKRVFRPLVPNFGQRQFR